MKLIALMASTSAVLLLLVGCGGINASNSSSLVTTENLSRIEVSNNQTGHMGLATTSADNLYELLNMLNLDGVTANRRISVPEPAASAYTLVAYDATRMVWTIRVLDSPASSRIYLEDAVHPAQSGTYTLTQPIEGADLDAFIHKYPAP